MHLAFAAYAEILGCNQTASQQSVMIVFCLDIGPKMEPSYIPDDHAKPGQGSGIHHELPGHRTRATRKPLSV